MTVSEGADTDVDLTQDRSRRFASTVGRFLARFVGEFAILNLFAGWILIWGLTARMNYMAGDSVAAGFIVVAFIVPAALGAVWYVVRTAFGDRLPTLRS